MPEITIGQLSEREVAKLRSEAERRGVPIEALAKEAIQRALDARAKRDKRIGNLRALKRP